MMRRLVLPLVALLLAGTATFAARSYLGDRGQPEAAVETPPPPRKAVLVAAQDLAAGSFIQPGSVRWQEWPEVVTPETYLLRGEKDQQELVGAVVRRPLAVGEPMVDGNLVKPGDRGFLAAVLDPGMRALSVPVDEASSNAGLIFPGDRVDLILTQTIEPTGDGDGARRVSETVLEDVRIIAMGRQLNAESSAEGDEGKPVRTATLEATPAAAEKIAMVTELGKLSLSLRSLAVADASRPAPTGTRFTWDTDVSPALRPENQPHTSLSVVRGDKLETITIRRGAGS
ncbi:MAG TPA: Flp pilus assembly protein CpaB [Geminicoccaceae bacterium]|nr:Flp pilus assembly protein CpaB [Geminicoccaceae bacterium]